MKKISPFQLVLGLLIAGIAADVIFLSYIGIFGPPARASRLVSALIISVILALGIWLHSKIARWVAALFHLGLFGFAIWPVVSGTVVWNFGVPWAASKTVISALLAYVLILSPGFSKEFAARRSSENPRKALVRKVLLIGAIAAAIIATLYDAYKFYTLGTL